MKMFVFLLFLIFIVIVMFIAIAFEGLSIFRCFDYFGRFTGCQRAEVEAFDIYMYDVKKLIEFLEQC